MEVWLTTVLRNSLRAMPPTEMRKRPPDKVQNYFHGNLPK